ncbi:hypothetical protein ACHAXR_008189 [Thalassiosira sp. AJA248-18]
MGKKSRRNKNVTKDADLNNVTGITAQNTTTPRWTSKVDQPPIEPGRTAIVHGLVNRSDLNNEKVTIKEILNNGRVAVERIILPDTELERREVIAIKPENLEVRWRTGNVVGQDMKDWGIEEEECPICMDTMMNTAKNASHFECCGGRICKKCFLNTQKTAQRDSCPLCRSDTSDTSESALVKKVRARANRGDANAMFNLGGYYDSGRGLVQDQALARVWIKRAAEKGESRAAHNLACSHRDGEGGPVDKALAAKYFRMAADKGHVQATTCLGIALMSGDGVERDMVESKKWLTKGARAGDELAVQQLQFHDMMSGLGGNVSVSSSRDGMAFSFGK